MQHYSLPWDRLLDAAMPPHRPTHTPEQLTIRGAAGGPQYTNIGEQLGLLVDVFDSNGQRLIPAPALTWSSSSPDVADVVATACPDAVASLAGSCAEVSMKQSGSVTIRARVSASPAIADSIVLQVR